MKKIFVIVLIMLVFSLGVEAKVKFGSWDKWDEELPPADNENWHWIVSDNEAMIWKLKGFGNAGSDVVLLFSDLYFYGVKSGKTKASAFFYSLDMDVKKWDIFDASLALVAFPPTEGRVTIRAYKMENEKFQFFEEWQIAFQNQEVVVPKDTEFRKILKEWLEKQIAPGRTFPGDRFEVILPELVIKKKLFRITNSYKFKE